MKEIFKNFNYSNLYKKCIMSSIAHAIMVGNYDLLSSEQSWDGFNYNFQNMEGTRGIISFGKEVYVCLVQNNVEYKKYNEYYISELFDGIEETTFALVKEALQYMLVDYNGYVVPVISTAFWGNRNSNFSNQSEEEIIKLSEEVIVPFLYNENDAKKYWKNYYEMTNEQVRMMEEIYSRRINLKGNLKLTSYERAKLEEWSDNIDECIESFKELHIFLD